VPQWLRYMRANALVARAKFDAALPLFSELAAADTTDGFASFMLATCYEQAGDVEQALQWAQETARRMPNSVTAQQEAARLSVSADQHDQATEYVLRALALPEMATEMPGETLLPRPLRGFLWLLHHTPFVRRRLRAEALADVEPAGQSRKLHEWKEWAQAYLAWRRGADGAPAPPTLH
jgi:tetratricopeptide (TPR) repeat protein